MRKNFDYSAHVVASGCFVVHVGHGSKGSEHLKFQAKKYRVTVGYPVFLWLFSTLSISGRFTVCRAGRFPTFRPSTMRH